MGGLGVGGLRSRATMVVSDGTKTLASTVSRGMFYPSLLYNLARYKLQGPGYAWWTKILGDGECRCVRLESARGARLVGDHVSAGAAPLTRARASLQRQR